MASEDDDFDDDEEEEADTTAPVFNERDELEEPSYAAAGTMALGNEDVAGKKRKRRPKGPAPLDAEGFPKHWDEDRGEWVEGVGVEATGPELTDQWLQTRLSQTVMHLEKIQREGGVHGTSLITYDELAECRSDLERALAGAFRDRVAAKQEATASSIFWAIALARNAAARRHTGWVVDSAEAADCWSMDRLHTWLTNYKGEKIATEEGGDGPLTKVGRGAGRGRGGGRHGTGAAAGKGGVQGEEVKKRRLRVDALGDSEARREKLQSLHNLILLGGGRGLATPILEMAPPTLRVFEGKATEGSFVAAGAQNDVGPNRGGSRAKALARYADKANQKAALGHAGGPVAGRWGVGSGGEGSRSGLVKLDDESTALAAAGDEDLQGADDDDDDELNQYIKTRPAGASSGAPAPASAQMTTVTLGPVPVASSSATNSLMTTTIAAPAIACVTGVVVDMPLAVAEPPVVVKQEEDEDLLAMLGD